MSVLELESLLKFVTGVGILPRNQIVIQVSESASIFASSCLMKLSLPEMLKTLEQDTFNTTMRAANTSTCLGISDLSLTLESSGLYSTAKFYLVLIYLQLGLLLSLFVTVMHCISIIL